MLLVLASAAVYALGLAIAESVSERAKQAYMAIGVAAVVAVIVVFKAAGAWRGVLLPFGSLSLVQLISYLSKSIGMTRPSSAIQSCSFCFRLSFRRLSAGQFNGPSVLRPDAQRHGEDD